MSIYIHTYIHILHRYIYTFEQIHCTFSDCDIASLIQAGVAGSKACGE